MTTSAQPFGSRSREVLIALDGASSEVPSLAWIYRGSALSPAGSVLGGVWAFMDGLAGGAFFGRLYHALTGRLNLAAGPEERPAVAGNYDGREPDRCRNSCVTPATLEIVGGGTL